MSGPRRFFFRVARAMVTDGTIVSGLVLALLGDAYVWRESGDWSWPLGCLAIQVSAAAAIVIAGEYWMSASKKGSCTDAECRTAGTERASTRTA